MQVLKCIGTYKVYNIDSELSIFRTVCPMQYLQVSGQSDTVLIWVFHVVCTGPSVSDSLSLSHSLSLPTLSPLSLPLSLSLSPSRFSSGCHLSVDKSYCPCLMALNKSFLIYE